MKAKTKRKIKHHVAKRHLVRRKASERFMRSVIVFIATISTGSLAFAIATTKPTIEVEVRTNLDKALSAPSVTQIVRGKPDQAGSASWYALGLPAPDNLTCASTKFPRGTYLYVRNQRNGKSVMCLVNDYGPEAWTNRAVDLSRGSFRLIEDLGRGTTPVEIWVVPPPPTSINLPIPKTLGSFIGYNLCRQRYDAAYCEANRHRAKKIRP